MKDKKIDLVIARYNEPLDWLNEHKDKKFNKIFIYNKGSSEVTCPIKPVSGDVIYTKLPNVGRCDHTYIYHIIHNYNKLGDVTIFTKGSTICPGRHGYHEPSQFNKIIKTVFETGNTVFVGDKHNENLGRTMGSFTMNHYVSYCSVNVNSTTKPRLHPANPRPYSAWYAKHFPNIDENRVSYRGVFSVSKAHIHNRKKDAYQPFLQELEVDSNPEAGHYMERSWLALFYKIPEECFFTSSAAGGRRKTKKKKRSGLR